jgi:hypothetical protein
VTYTRAEVIAAAAKLGRIPEPLAAAALAIEETPEFHRVYLPCLNGEIHPAAVAMARAALAANGD